VHDQIDFGPAPLYVATNIARAKNKGFELNGFTELAGISIKGNLTLQNPENRDTGEGLPRRAEQIATLEISRKWGNWQLGGDVHYERHRPDSQYNDYELGSYALVNLHARYQLTKELWLFGRIDNLLDKDYQTAYSYNQPGRGFFAGIGWKM
jgi:vitamin B12 transporter